MKKYLTCFVLMGIVMTSLWAWEMETFTNKNNVYSFFEFNGDVLATSWGGVANIQTGETFTTQEGLSATDITAAWVDSVAGFVWLATGGKGVARYDFQNRKSFQPFNTNYGLLSDFVNCVAGYWDSENEISTVLVGTEEGLSAFQKTGTNDYTFKNTYTEDSGLSNNWIIDILIRQDGRVFLATQNGLTTFPIDQIDYPETWMTYNVDQGLAHPQINSLESQDGKIYCGTDHWISIFDFENEQFSSMGLPPGGSRDWPVYDMLVRGDGSLLVTICKISSENLLEEKSYGIAVYQDENWVRWYTSNGAPTNALTGLWETAEALYVGSWGDGVFKVHAFDQLWEEYSFPGPVANQLSVLRMDHHNYLWYATGSRVNLSKRQARYGNRGYGYYSSQTNDWQGYSELSNSSPLSSDKVLALEMDAKNRVWVGAWHSEPNALVCYHANLESFDVYSPEEEDFLFNDQFSVFALDPQGNFYISSYADLDKGGVTILPNSTVSEAIKFRPSRLINDYSDIYSIAFYENEVWLGGKITGLQSWTPSTSIFPGQSGDYWNTTYKPISDVSIYDMDVDADGNLIMATAEGLMIHFRETDNLYCYNAVEKKKRWVVDWTNDGDWILDAEYEPGEERLGNGECSEIADVAVDAQGNVWMATFGGGVSVLTEEDRFVNITEKDGLINNRVTALCIDEERGVLWAGTVTGLNRISIPFLSNREQAFTDVVVYPNPFNPRAFAQMYFGKEREGLPAGTSQLRIFDLQGEMIFESSELNYQRQFVWDGKNQDGQLAASGLYYFLILNEKTGKTVSGKFALLY